MVTLHFNLLLYNILLAQIRCVTDSSIKLMCYYNLMLLNKRCSSLSSYRKESVDISFLLVTKATLWVNEHKTTSSGYVRLSHRWWCRFSFYLLRMTHTFVEIRFSRLAGDCCWLRGFAKTISTRSVQHTRKYRLLGRYENLL